MIQTVILAILFFVIVFGIGFILNMLLKTTWLPLYLYILLVIGMVIRYWTLEDGTLWETMGGFSVPDYTTALGGLAGGWLTGWTIRNLRTKGYKMF